MLCPCHDPRSPGKFCTVCGIVTRKKIVKSYQRTINQSGGAFARTTPGFVSPSLFLTFDSKSSRHISSNFLCLCFPQWYAETTRRETGSDVGSRTRKSKLAEGLLPRASIVTSIVWSKLSAGVDTRTFDFVQFESGKSLRNAVLLAVAHWVSRSFTNNENYEEITVLQSNRAPRNNVESCALYNKRSTLGWLRDR